MNEFSEEHNITDYTLPDEFEHSVHSKFNPKLKDLLTLLKDYKTDGAEFNIIDQVYFKKYNIPDNRLPEFFRLVDELRRNKTKMGFCERQKGPSGIMIDYDVFQSTEKRILDGDDYLLIIHSVLDLLKGYLKNLIIKDSYVLVIRKPNVEFRKEEKHYKDGFHILLPGIKICKSIKRKLMSDLSDLDLFKEHKHADLFVNRDEMVDTHSANVPVLFVGCSKKGKIPYVPSHLFKISYDKFIMVNTLTIDSINTPDFNLSHEFSLNYEKKDGTIKKTIFEPNENIKIDDFNTYDEELVDDPDKTLCINSITDPEFREVSKMVSILNPKRCEDYKQWFSVVCALASEGDKYKSIAFKFSGIREKGVRDEFERTWNTCIHNKDRYRPYNRQMILNYARKDNPDEYKTIYQEGYMSFLCKFVIDDTFLGLLGHFQIASLLYKMIGRKFAVDKAKGSTNFEWYEFITYPQSNNNPELWKWKKLGKGIKPVSLSKYLSIKVPNALHKVIENIKSKLDESPEDDQDRIDYYKKLMSNLKKTIINASSDGWKNSVFNQCRTVFYRKDFADSLDTNEDCIGVGNGILLLKPTIKLIQDYNHFNISRYTKVHYKPFTLEDENINLVFESLWNLFPEDEKDVFHYLMFYFAMSLTGRRKPTLFMFLIGNGANGKSFLLETIRGLLGEYGCKLPISYLVGKDAGSGAATPELMPLIGSRFAYFSESDKSERLRPSKMKRLTSHEPINVRQLYGEQQTVVHNSNFILCSNYNFTIDATDNGTWRRIMYYNMKFKFCKNPEGKYERKANTKLAGNKTRDNLFLSGAMSILTVYLFILDREFDGDFTNVPCATIQKETDIYRESQDYTNRFINDRIVMSSGQTVDMPDLVEKYIDWYNSTITEMKYFDKQDIRLQFENSKLQNKFTKNAKNSKTLIGYRILDAGEDKDEHESYISQRKRTNSIKEEQFLKDANGKGYKFVMKKLLEKFVSLEKSTTVDDF